MFVRKRAKEYGTLKVAEGGPVAGKRVVLVEDVVTTGGALLESGHQVRAAGAELGWAVCAIGLRSALTRHDLEQRP